MDEANNQVEDVNLTRFRVCGLFGRLDFDIPISQARLVLIGENGTGKSTLVTILYLILSNQWERLIRIEFESLELQFNNETYRVTHSDLEEFLTYRQQHRIRSHSRVHPRIERQIAEELRARGLIAHNLTSRQRDLFSADLARELGIPPSVIRRSATFQLSLFEELDDEPPRVQTIRETLARLSDHFDASAVFLPTYRRIERDLAEILPMVEESKISREPRKRIRPGKSGFLELVQFGMEDVKELFANTMLQAEAGWRRGLDNLTSEYLREVLNRNFQIDSHVIHETNETVLRQLLERIEGDVLRPQDKDLLWSTIQKIREQNSLDSGTNEVVIHFVSKLIRLHTAQIEQEQDVRSFVNACNRYLIDKKVHFDSPNFTLEIQQEGSKGELDLSYLSSGEKQIVSLFAHLYLSESERFFVIIDEPEMSLSVPWQRTFLPDVLAAEQCVGLVAVTHSPFIYANELEHFTHPLLDFSYKQ